MEEWNTPEPDLSFSIETKNEYIVYYREVSQKGDNDWIESDRHDTKEQALKCIEMFMKEDYFQEENTEYHIIETYQLVRGSAK